MSLVDWLAARIRCLLRGHDMTLRWTGGGNDGWTPLPVRQCDRCGAIFWDLEVDW